MMKTVTVSIDADGHTEVETSGFSGAECLKETEGLERALGGAVSVKKTREYFAATTHGEKAKEKA